MGNVYVLENASVVLVSRAEENQEIIRVSRCLKSGEL